MLPTPEKHCETSSSLNTEMTDDAQKQQIYNDPHYREALHMSDVNSDDHELIREFLDVVVPDLISNYAKPSFNVLGIGSGSGKMDIHLLSTIQKLRPDLKIYNETIDPSQEEMDLFKDNLSRATGLNNVTFSWHSKDVVQYEKDAKLNNNVKKFDLIHMIQMLYYVKPVKETLEFLKSCLSPEGKMVIVVLSGESGWNRMTRKYEWLWREEFNLGLNSEAVTDILEGLSMKYEIHDIDCFFDVTECLEEGNKAGEMLLDVLTDFARFAETAPPDHKAQVLADIQSPEFSIRKDGKVWFDTRLKGIVARL